MAGIMRQNLAHYPPVSAAIQPRAGFPEIRALFQNIDIVILVPEKAPLAR